ncbi:hypothetical protein Dsin_001428 [Dipteronia sinensis]|uniref:hAT-like transposase RNase-H fold domain-containing protein n=1 Tax=Dipteronia sinensis TaxID=43782 RepID=A0AAE0B498_9ROSI|nr:hypothetical protein Dsin_001428 [Dipteronia sinensis]
MKGKGRMMDNLGHDDRAYHEYLQQQVYVEDLGLNFPQSHSHPSLRISEPDLNVTPILTSQSENMPDLGHDGDEPDPNPHQDFDFYPQMEEKLPKQVKFDLFVLHMKKVTHEDGSTVVICNYCKKVFKWHKSGGYGSYRKHITNSHPDAQAKSSSQSQILRTTLTEALENIYEKEKKILEKILEKYNGRVSVCADIWSDHWQMHSYIGVTCHYMDNAWTIQKRILAFRVFDEKHTAANIFRHLRIIFTEYKIENKIFAIGFDNASNNTAAIPALIELCKPYLGANLFIIESLNIAGAFAHCESDSELHEFVTAMKDKWLEYYKEFPNIYLIALCFDPRCRLEISTVTVEQQFSAGGNILDPKRSLMSPKSLQIQACVEDWTKAQYRQQEIDQEEPYDFFKDDQPAESRTDDHGND